MLERAFFHRWLMGGRDRAGMSLSDPTWLLGCHPVPPAVNTSGLFHMLLIPPCVLQVVTFDARGVSGHLNHTAVHRGVRYIKMAQERTLLCSESQ